MLEDWRRGAASVTPSSECSECAAEDAARNFDGYADRWLSGRLGQSMLRDTPAPSRASVPASPARSAASAADWERVVQKVRAQWSQRPAAEHSQPAPSVVAAAPAAPAASPPRQPAANPSADVSGLLLRLDNLRREMTRVSRPSAQLPPPPRSVRELPTFSSLDRSAQASQAARPASPQQQQPPPPPAPALSARPDRSCCSEVSSLSQTIPVRQAQRRPSALRSPPRPGVARHRSTSAPVLRFDTQSEPQRVRPIVKDDQRQRRTNRPARRPARATQVPRRAPVLCAARRHTDDPISRNYAQLLRTVSKLEDERELLAQERDELYDENERYRSALVARDAKLCKVRQVRRQLESFSAMTQKGADIFQRHQQGLDRLSSAVDELFTEWRDPRASSRSRSVAARYR